MGNYPLQLLKKGEYEPELNRLFIRKQSKKFERMLSGFSSKVKVKKYSRGPSVKKYEIALGKGVKISDFLI